MSTYEQQAREALFFMGDSATKEEAIEAIAAALANERTRGRAEGLADALEIAQRYEQPGYAQTIREVIEHALADAQQRTPGEGTVSQAHKIGEVVEMVDGGEALVVGMSDAGRTVEVRPLLSPCWYRAYALRRVRSAP